MGDEGRVGESKGGLEREGDDGRGDRGRVLISSSLQ